MYVKPCFTIQRYSLCRTCLTVMCDLSWQDLPYTRHVTAAGLANETDLYFVAVVERGTGRTRALMRDWPMLIQ